MKRDPARAPEPGAAGVSAREAAVSALADPEDRVRCAAIRALHESRDAPPIAEAVAWLPEEGHSRALAFSALARLDVATSAPLLASSLVHGSAARGLWPEEVEVVAELCSDRRGARRRVLSVLVKGLHAEDDEAAERAEAFLTWFGDDAAPAVARAARRRSAAHRCARILGRTGGAGAVEALTRLLEHKDPRARAEACAALGELRDPASAEALLRATRDSEHTVRMRAASALDRIGTAAVVTVVSALAPPPAGSRR